MTLNRWVRGSFTLCAALFFFLLPSLIGGQREGTGKAVSPVSNEITGNAQLVMPQSLQWIGEGAFEGTAAQEVVLRSDVYAIERRAFADMVNLKKINLPESVEIIGGEVFGRNLQVVIYGVAGGKAENYANENQLEFQPLDVALPSLQLGAEKAGNHFLPFILLLALILIYHARSSGRRLCETRMISKRRFVVLHPLDLYFP